MFIKRKLVHGLAAAMLLHSAHSLSQELLVNFRDTDLKEVVSFVSEVTGKTFVVDPMVKGRVMVVAEKPVSPDELYQLFLSVLEVHNFVALENDGIVKIVPRNETRTASVPVSVSRNTKSSGDIITQVIPVYNVSAVQLLPVLRPMVRQEAHLAAYEPSNSIVITDSAANAQRIRQLVSAFDGNAIGESEVIMLRHAGAEAMAELVRKTLVGDSDNKGLKVANVVADSRANRLLVTGDLVSRKRVRELVRRLDTDIMARSSSNVVELQYADAKEVAAALSEIATKMGGENSTASVVSSESLNAIMLSGDPSTITSLKSLASELDVPRSQVLVEAIIVELQDTAAKELGVQWLFANQKSGVYGSSARPGADSSIGAVTGAVVNDTNNPDVAALGAALSSVSGQTLGIGGVSGDISFNVLINALQEQNGANILSTPSVLTLDNREATISVGQEVPFVTGSYTSQGSGSNPSNPFQTINREEVGITLTVTPRVNDDDRVLLDILQEVSSISGQASVDASDIITNNREITTQVIANNGEVVVLGGLIQDDVQQVTQKVPVLGSIPLLGRLFRNENNRAVKTNLVVFIRATVLDDPIDVRKASMNRYEEIRDKQLGLPEISPKYGDDIEQPVVTDQPVHPLVDFEK